MDNLLSILQKNYQDVVKRTAVYDKQFNVPSGTVSLSLTITLLILLTYVFYSSCCSSSRSSSSSRKKISSSTTHTQTVDSSTGNPIIRSEPPKTLSKEAKNTLIIMGPTDSGKTCMLHQLAFGKDVATVPSMMENVLKTPLHAVSNSPIVTLVDYPGASQLRPGLIKRASDCGGYIFVVDASGNTEHDKQAAECLAELFTNRQIYDNGVPLCLVLNKMDQPKARTVEQVRTALEAQLYILQQSSAGSRGVRIAASVDNSSTRDNGASETLLLGRAEEPFDFDEDCPCPVTWCETISANTGKKNGHEGSNDTNDDNVNVDSVKEFILDLVD